MVNPIALGHELIFTLSSFSYEIKQYLLEACGIACVIFFRPKKIIIIQNISKDFNGINSIILRNKKKKCKEFYILFKNLGYN